MGVQRLVDVFPSVSASQIVAELIPPQQFVDSSFGNYIPSQDEPTQVAAREGVDVFAQRVGAPVPKGFFKKNKAPEGRPGVYLDGGFGVGKTHLLAALWHASPQPKSFGTFVEYTNVIGLLGFRKAVEQFANRKLVCIDEFELDDPGDTVLMSTFLNELVDRGVSVAATSNTLPDRLGEERFAADNFLREIQGLSAHFDVIRIEGPDYRQRNLDLNQKVFTHSEVQKFCAATTHAALDEWQGLLDHLSKVHPAQYGPMVENLSLLGLQDVNVVRNENQALRVVSLVDRLYDRSVPIVNSGVDITSIFTDSMLKGGYRKKYFRALSRLAALAQLGAAMVE
jgi:cell division protein ZapE